MAVTPHSVRPYSPLTGHHLNPCAVSLWTSLPMWKASMAPTAMSSSSVSLVRFWMVMIPSSLLSLLTYAM